jgi:hypothetical protein
MRKIAPLALALFCAAAVPVLAQQKSPARQATPDVAAQPRYATVNLRADFSPDPHETRVEAGGDREVQGLGSDCTGWIDYSRPDVDLNYQAGNLPLYISVVAQADTTLIINDPSGRWICNDDMEGLNPGIIIQRPASGNYNIWIGTVDRGPAQPATLRISEVPPNRRK